MSTDHERNPLIWLAGLLAQLWPAEPVVKSALELEVEERMRCEDGYEPEPSALETRWRRENMGDGY